METHVRWAADEKAASVYSADQVVIRKLNKLCEEYPEGYELIRQDEYGSTYRVDKKLLSFRKPRKISDEHLQKLRENILREKENSF